MPLPLCRYASNTGLLILNKWLLSTYGFRKPVFLTLCHMLACSAMGAGASAARIVPPQPIKSPEQFRKIAGLAVVFCLSVVLGNVALRFIPVSFSQARPGLVAAEGQQRLRPCSTSILRISMMSVGCCISLLLLNGIMHGRRSGDQSDVHAQRTLPNSQPCQLVLRRQLAPPHQCSRQSWLLQ